MSRHTFLSRTLGVLAAGALTAVCAAPAQAAERSWIAQHAGATAQGTTTTGPAGPYPWSPESYQLQGSLTSTTGCASVWLVEGVAPVGGRKLAQTCGGSSAGFIASGTVERWSGLPRLAWVRVCAGTSSMSNCGPAVQVV